MTTSAHSLMPSPTRSPRASSLRVAASRRSASSPISAGSRYRRRHGSMRSWWRSRGLVAGEVGRGTYVRSSSAPLPLLSASRAVRLLTWSSIFPADAPGCPDGRRPGSAFPLGKAGEGHSPHICLSDTSSASDRGSVLAQGRMGAESGSAALAQQTAGQRSPRVSRRSRASGTASVWEAMTYPAVVGIAAQLGITLVPLPLDEEGIRPRIL